MSRLRWNGFDNPNGRWDPGGGTLHMRTRRIRWFVMAAERRLSWKEDNHEPPSDNHHWLLVNGPLSTRLIRYQARIFST